MGHISDADDIFTEPKKLSVFFQFYYQPYALI